MTWLKNIRLTTLGWLMPIIIVGASVSQIGLGAVNWRNMIQVRALWSQYRDDGSEKHRALFALQRELGFGGMIHLLKELELSLELFQVTEVRKRIGSANAALDLYASARMNEAEAAAIQKFRAALKSFDLAIDEIVTLAEFVDIVELDDVTADIEARTLEALAVLTKETEAAMAGGGAESYVRLLGALHADLGMGGAIHAYETFLIRRDPALAEQAIVGFDRANRTVAALTELPDIAAEGKTALAELQATLAVYRTALDRAREMAAADAPPREIQEAVAVDYQPALAALGVLEDQTRVWRTDQESQISTHIDDAELVLFISGLFAGPVAMLLCVAIFLVIRTGVVRPVRGLTGLMGRLADGDSSVDVAPYAGDNEIGEMASAVEVFRKNKLTADRLAADAAAEQTERVERAERLTELTAEFDRAVRGLLDELGTSSTRLEDTSSSMLEASRQSADMASSATSASGQVSVSVQSVSGSSERLMASVDKIARQIRQASDLSGRAADEARASNRVAHGLAGSAESIGQVVNLISDIAKRTNLLALNATIEAARAGDAGRGFAVVASEVKGLATQTAQATDRISGSIEEMQNSAKRSVEAISAIAGRVDEIHGISAAISAAMQEQSSAIQEIDRNIQQASSGVGDVTRSVAGVGDAAKQTDAAAENVLAAANDVSTRSDRLKETVAGFLHRVRS